jgi:hypothetical protein
MSYGLGPPHSPFKNNSRTRKSPPLLQKVPCLCLKSSRSPLNFQTAPLEIRNISRLALTTFQKFQIGPYNFFSSYLFNPTLISAILMPKFSESSYISFHASIIHVCCILIDCVLMIRWFRAGATSVHGISRHYIWGLQSILLWATRQLSLNVLHIHNYLSIL